LSIECLAMGELMAGRQWQPTWAWCSARRWEALAVRGAARGVRGLGDPAARQDGPRVHRRCAGEGL